MIEPLLYVPNMIAIDPFISFNNASEITQFALYIGELNVANGISVDF